jgi:hypothetical protein
MFGIHNCMMSNKVSLIERKLKMNSNYVYNSNISTAGLLHNNSIFQWLTLNHF